MTEAALVLASWLFSLLGLAFYLVLVLKPAQNKVAEEPGQEQNSERL